LARTLAGQPGPDQALAGMGLMLLCCLLFAAMGACFRGAMLRRAAGAAAALRARLLHAAGAVRPGWLRAGPGALRSRRPGAHLFRCAAGLAGFFLHMLAILWLPLADAVAILHARPLWALPLAFLLLGERIGWDRAVAAAVGFCGVLLIAGAAGRAFGRHHGGARRRRDRRAGADLDQAALGHRAAVARRRLVRDRQRRGLGAGLGGGVGHAVAHGAGPAAGRVADAVLGDFCASWAVRRAPVGLLAPVEYAQIPASALFGAAFFAETPGWMLLWGTLVMVGATLYLARGAARG
jgi:drug/metabolite transporter (DMT)-like permease